MKFKMNFSYHFVETPTVVVCYASPQKRDRTLDLAYRMYRLATEEEAYRSQTKPRSLTNKIKAEYKGVAVLKNGDKNNLDEARRIARLKATRAAYKGFKAMLKEIYTYLDRTKINQVSLFVDIDSKIKRSTDEIYKIVHKAK